MTSLLRYKPRKETRRIILHDSHTVPEIQEVMDVPRWASLAQDGALKMGLMSIGYHFIIERNGFVVGCRDVDLIGSHTPGFNMDSVGICLVGGREELDGEGVDNFTKGQRHALLSLCHELRLKYPGVVLQGHTEVQRYRRRDHPPCPPIDMDLLREDLDLYSKGYVL